MLKLTESPRTENVWYDVTLADAKTKERRRRRALPDPPDEGLLPLWAEETKAKG